jgi:hypothetical protein
MSKTTIRNILIALSFFAGGAAALMFVFLQVQDKGGQLREHIKVVEEERIEENTRVQQQRVLDDTVEERSALKGYYLGDESDSIDFLNHVESLAKELDISLNTADLEKVEIDTQTWIAIDYAFSGKEQAVKDFVSVLETLPYVLELTRLELNATEGLNWSATVSLQVRVL